MYILITLIAKCGKIETPRKLGLTLTLLVIKIEFTGKTDAQEWQIVHKVMIPCGASNA